MKEKLKNLCVHSTAIVFFVLAVFLVPIAMYTASAFDRYALVAVLGLDAKDDKYEVSALVITPQVSGQFSESLRKFDSSGDSVAQCLLSMGISLGKQIDLAHCEAIVLGDEILEDDATKYLDYFMRNSNLAINSILINAPGGANELLDAISSAQTNDDISIQNIIAYHKDVLFTAEVNVGNYYRYYNRPDQTYFLPIFEGKQGGSAANDGGSKAGGEAEGDGGAGMPQGGGGGDKTIDAAGKTALIKAGKKLRELDQEEIIAYNIFSRWTTRTQFTVPDPYHDGMLVIDGTEKKVSVKTRFEDGVPVITFKVSMLALSDELQKSRYNLTDFFTTDSMINVRMKDIIHDRMEGYLDMLAANIARDNTDTLDIYQHFDAFHHSEWQEFVKRYPNDYLSHVKFEFQSDIKDTL